MSVFPPSYRFLFNELRPLSGSYEIVACFRNRFR
jgi:hypothetical protein